MAYINKSITDDWRTPKEIYKFFMDKNFFDPCPFQSDIDGLKINWGQNTFCNPPYSKLKLWVQKAIEEAKKGKNIYLLIPSRTDTKAFLKLFEYGCEFFFFIGRLHFNENSNPAPFPSVLINLNGKNTINYGDLQSWLKRNY